jgi:perosamine synthetase
VVHEQLAVCGGSGVVDVSLHRGWPEIREEDRRAVLGVLDRGVLSGPTAPEVAGLERDFADYLGVEYCLALNSGTAALHCCCAAAGLGPGDEVIVPALTFIASAMAVCQQGATPVFCDIDPVTYNIDPGLIEERITQRTRAIMVVHLHGLPCDMDSIQQIADRHGLLVIEDAAQAPGATYKQKKVGSLGHTAGFSLQQTKNLCGGDGGLFVTNDEHAYQTAARLRLFGEDAESAGKERPYFSHGLGFNYRDHELSAALARSQLRRLDHYNESAQSNAHLLTERLFDVPGLVTPRVPDDRDSVFYLYRLRLRVDELGFDGRPTELRDRVMEALRAEGVETRLWQHWTMPAHPVFRHESSSPWGAATDGALRDWDAMEFPVATRLLAQSVCIGSEQAPLMVQRAELMHLYAEAISKVVLQIDDLARLPHAPPELPA